MGPVVPPGFLVSPGFTRGYGNAALRAGDGGGFGWACLRSATVRSSHLRLPPAVLPRLGFGAEPGFAAFRGEGGGVVAPLAGEVAAVLSVRLGGVRVDEAAGGRASGGWGTAVDGGLDRGRRRSRGDLGGRLRLEEWRRELRRGSGWRRDPPQDQQGGQDQERQDDPGLRRPESRPPAPAVDPGCDVFAFHGSSLNENRPCKKRMGLEDPESRTSRDASP